jgi:hypothetical protein
VIVAVVVLGILGLVGLAAAGLWFAKTHIDVRTVSSATVVNADFERIRERFTNQRPLIELDERGHFLRANPDRPPSQRRPDTLNIMAFDPDEGRVVKMDIPFWLLRLKMGGTHIGLGNDSIDLHDLRITIEDLERYGPTLIVDHKGRHGEHVLVWSQ